MEQGYLAPRKGEDGFSMVETKKSSERQSGGHDSSPLKSVDPKPQSAPQQILQNEIPWGNKASCMETAPPHPTGVILCEQSP